MRKRKSEEPEKHGEKAESSAIRTPLPFTGFEDERATEPRKKIYSPLELPEGMWPCRHGSQLGETSVQTDFKNCEITNVGCFICIYLAVPHGLWFLQPSTRD